MLSFNLFAQSTKVEDINNNPHNYEGNDVIVKGLVTQYVKGIGSTSYYLLKGNFGSIIKVNTAMEAPETNAKYSVEGIVYINKKNGIPFISETSRSKIGETFVSTDSQTVTQSQQSGSQSGGKEEKPNNLLIYILIGALIILVVVYFLIRSRQNSKTAETEYASSNYISSSVSSSDPDTKLNRSGTQESFRDDFKTVKITTTSPKTLKFIPGKLTVVTGEDTGKSFRIAGYPTSDGNIVSIGREGINGDRSYSHIQLMQKTISRKQAEIIQRDGSLYIKNLSDTNRTQLNGIEFKVGEQTELKPGAVIKIGELELKYEI